MRQMRRVLSFLLIMVMLFGGWTSAGMEAGAAGEFPSESRAAEETESERETESAEETDPSGEMIETGSDSEKQTDQAEETETGSAGTEETEITEEADTVEGEEGTDGSSEEETEESSSVEETETTEETGSKQETESTEESGVSKEEAALYGVSAPSVSYEVHMQTYSWLRDGKDGSVCGVPGSGKRMEAVALQVSGVDGLGVDYQVYSAGHGWLSPVADKEGKVYAGTVGEGKRIERIKASLTGAAADQYDIYYRVCVQGYGWLDWAENGGSAGVDSSLDRTVEAVQVRLQAKGSPAPGDLSSPYLKDPDQGYPNTHKNTGNRIQDMIAIAKTQVGYYKADGMATKYGTWYNVYVNASGDYYPSAAWCAMFMSWCADQANIPKTIFRMNASTVNMATWYQNNKNPGYWHDRGSYTPKAGDLIFFKFNTNNNYVNHVGIVTGISGGKVYTIEGNTSNSVRERSYGLNDTAIVGYATPDYNETGITAPPPADKQISYRANVEGKEWDFWVGDGESAGTVGSFKMLKALMVKLSDTISGGVTYRVHMQSYGWQAWVSDGEISGLPKESKRMEAVEIKLTGDAEKKYDIYYHVHCQSFGWLDWAKNGESAGSEGYGKRVEAIEIRLVPKGGAAPGKTTRPFVKKTTEAPTMPAVKPASVSYSTHCQTYGWLSASADGVMNGTEGKHKRLEGIKIWLSNVSGEISYRTHVQTYGWQGWVKNGAMSGTEGKYKRLEAIEIQLSGTAAAQYDIYYRVHSQTYGWMGWAKNGEPAGTSGKHKRLEAIEIRLVPKGGAAPGSTDRHYVEA